MSGDAMALEHGNLSVHEVTSDLELYNIWPEIRVGINAMRAKCPDMLDYPEHIFHEIKLKQSKLLVANIEGAYAGFFTVKTVDCADGHGLLIALIHNASTDPDYLYNFFKIIEELVKLTGYRRATFALTRKGWLPALNKLGYNSKNSVTYQTIEASHV